jgi:hypothetical protein
MTRAIVFAAAALLVACGKSKSAADTSTAANAMAPVVQLPTDVQTALAVDSAVRARPAKADSILKAHGLTAAGLDSLMYRIASDSSMRAQYAAARH